MPMTRRDRRALIIVGSIAVAAALVFFLFVSKGPKTATATGPGTTVVQPAEGTPSPSPGETKKKAKEVLVFSGRDPFDPSQGGGSLTPVSGTAPTVAPAGSPSAGPSGGSSTQIGDDTVVLVSVFTSDGVASVQVEVDGTVYTVGVGDTFANGYQLLSISGNCANFSHGSDLFTLCETANK